MGCPFLESQCGCFVRFLFAGLQVVRFTIIDTASRSWETNLKQEGCYEMTETEIVYEVEEGAVKAEDMNGKRKWKLVGKTAVRRYARLVDALIDFVETGDALRGKFLSSVFGSEAKPKMPGYGVVVRVATYRYTDGVGVPVGTPRVLHFRRYTVEDWKFEQEEER